MSDTTDQATEIQQSLELLHEPGSVFEVRCLGVPSGNGYENTASGYFDDPEKAAAAVARYEVLKPRGIYVTLNPCNPALIARANNRIVNRSKKTTQDADILRRQWLFFDIDPHRPSGIAATAEEVELARALAIEIEEKLRARGWPVPLIVESGNGVYLLFRIDLPNDDEATELVKQCYGGIVELLSRIDPTKPYAELDTGVYNAARILRIGGTTNRKGDPTEDRPHRQCVYFVPDPEQPVDVVPVEKLRELAALAPSTKTKSSKPSSSANGSRRRNGVNLSRLLVPDYLRANGVDFKIKESTGRTIYMVPCAFDASHGSNGESAVIQGDDGLTTYECKHNSCQGKEWRDYREAIGNPDPNHYDPPLPPRDRKKGKPSADSQSDAPEEIEPPAFATSLLTSAEFDAKAYKQEFPDRHGFWGG